MVVTVGLNSVVQLLQKFTSVAREKIDAPNAALLQALVGIERVAQGFGVTGDKFAFQGFCTSSLGLKTFELIFDLRSSCFRRVHQRAVELLQLFFDDRQMRVE